ncbi:hypothetical protein [Phaeobacter porticola]|uniref:hypothetical protein n=1 Tax=Phaeobacter porticola TaxID=1844006 RepID=UPI000AF65D39|nr:hypothetical protein [Phaeobacter porticola]
MSNPVEAITHSVIGPVVLRRGGSGFGQVNMHLPFIRAAALAGDQAHRLKPF